MSRLLLTATSLIMMLPTVGQAQGLTSDDPPPQNARPLSQLLPQIESRPDFAYISELEWDDDHYSISYQTRENDEKEINVDPITGEVTED